MNLPSIKNFGKYGLESIAIIVSVLFSFYLEDLRVTNEKTNYKNELVKNLKAIINEDLINIQNIKELQNRAYAGADLIINDMIDGKMDLDKKEIAENYLLVGQRGWVSFFPQNGSYTELISTGSLELIRSTNFRKALTNTYTHLYERNLQVSRTIDDFFLDAFFTNFVSPSFDLFFFLVVFFCCFIFSARCGFIEVCFLAFFGSGLSGRHVSK